MADPWADFPVVAPSSAPAPQSPPPFIAGTVPASKQAAEARANAAEARATRDQQIQEEKLVLDREKAQRDAVNGAESERKAAAFLLRALGANESYEATGVGPRSLGGQAIADAAPNLLNSLPASIGNSPARQVSDSAQDEFIAASLRQDSGAAIPAEELERQRRIYFPMPGDGPDVIEQKRQARIRAIEGLKQSSGVMLPGALARYEALRGQPQGGGQDGFTPEELQGGLTGSVSDESPNIVDPNDPNSPFSIRNRATGLSGIGTLGAQGITLGLSDEAAGIGGAISGLFNGQGVRQGYINARDQERMAIEQARQNFGIGGTALELLAGGGLGRIASAPMSVGQALRSGAGVGAAGGFGYGEGLEGSVVNAAGGAVIGGGLGAGLQAGGNALARYAGNRAAANAPLGQRAVDLQAAGQAENVTVNRAMVDPKLANRVTGVDSTLAGGKVVQPQIETIEGQIEGRVQNLGQGGTPFASGMTEGDTLKNASARFIKKTGETAKRKYDRAEQMAAGVKVTPSESLRRVDDMIATLSETPSTNGKEIAFLQDIKADLSKDLSVGGLRRMRTSLRQKISKGELTFGEDEARVLAIMDGAADDIRVGLTQAGKPQAAQAFDAADKSYRARMDYITGTLQKLIGRRNANLPSEQITAKFEAMARGKDARGLNKFYATLTPEERADVSATFAEQLGKNNKGDFTVTQFLRQSEKMSPEAIRTVFGPEGAQSIKNLRLLGAEVERVTKAMNSRKSGTGVANDWRSWLINAVLGTGTAVGTSSSLTGAAVAAAGAGTKMARDVLSARALMSPNITKWLKMAPRTANPNAINAHFEQLGKIATVEPALAGEIKALQDAILKAANDNSAVVQSVASDQNSNNVP